MSSDEPDFETLMAHERAEAEEAEDRAMRAFGERPKGQEYWAEVDEEMLGTTDPDSSDWRRALSYLGLSTLDPADKAMPAPLRALLTVNDDDSSPVLGWVGLGVAGVGMVGFTAVDVWHEGPSGLVWLIIGAFVAALGFAAGMLLDQALHAVHVLPPYPTAVQRRDTALEALRHAPFVRMISGKLVVNVPSLSWLKSRQAELRDADKRCDDQVREIDGILERTKQLEDKLGQHDGQPQETALKRRKTEVRVLQERVHDLGAKLAARQKAIEEGLAKVRSTAELASLRDRSAALLGQQPADDASRIAADLEVDVGDLAQQFDAVKGDLSDQENRWKAEAEVAGLAH